MTVPDPLGRKETYYSAILGRDVETPEPLGREEMYLEAISEHTHDMEDDIDTLQHQVAAMASDMKYKGSVADYEHLPTNASRGDVYTTLDTGKEYVYDGTTWVEISGGSGSQVETMPTASAETVGEIVQYVGETTTDYTNGYFYKGTGSEATNERVAYAVCTYGLLTNLAVDREQLTLIANYSNTTSGIIELAVMGSEWSVKHDGSYSSIEGGSDLSEIGLFGVTYDGTAGEGTTVVLGFASGNNENEVVVSSSGNTLTATLNEYTLAAYTQNSTGSVIFELKNDPVYGNGWQMLVPENLAPAQNPIIDLSAFGITLDGEAYVGDRIALFYGVEVSSGNSYAWAQLNVQPAGGSSTVIWGDIEGNLSSQADLQSALNAKQTTANLVTTVSASSTDTQYPSAKLLYDTVGNVETLLTTLISGGGAQ